MTAYGTWVSYSGSAGSGSRSACWPSPAAWPTPGPGCARPGCGAAGRKAAVALLVVWATSSLPLFFGFVAIYIQHYANAYPSLTRPRPLIPSRRSPSCRPIAVFIACWSRTRPGSGQG